MPEGPSIVLLREAASPFRGHVVRGVSGNSRMALSPLQGRRVKAVRRGGTPFLLEFLHHTPRHQLPVVRRWRTSPSLSCLAYRSETVFPLIQQDFYQTQPNGYEKLLTDVYLGASHIPNN